MWRRARGRGQARVSQVTPVVRHRRSVDANLRKRLMDITETADLTDHPALIEEMRTQFCHTIARRQGPAAVDRYTCAVYAFDLVEDPTYVSIATFGLGRTYAGAEFVEFLLENGLLTERPLEGGVEGDLVMYLDDGRFRHVGKLHTPNRVVSKWGTGHLWEHELWEVPLNYGNELRFFEGPVDDAGLDLFIKFAESKGFLFAGNDA